jgi:hypothetical protein
MCEDALVHETVHTSTNGLFSTPNEKTKEDNVAIGVNLLENIMLLENGYAHPSPAPDPHTHPRSI